MKRFLRCENPSRCYLNANNQIMLAQCTILQSKHSSHTIWHLKKYAVFSTYCAVCRTLVLHYEHSEWNVSCDRLLMHIQDPLLGCMNRLHKHQRKKIWGGTWFCPLGVYYVFIVCQLSQSYMSDRLLEGGDCPVLTPVHTSSEKCSLQGGGEVNRQYSFHGD